MRIVRGFAVGLVAFALVGLIVTPSVAFEKLGDRVPTVGDFLAAYARTLNIELPKSAGADTIMTVLRASGVKLDAKIDPASVLTQGEVVKIATANGIRVTTRSPIKAFSEREMEQFFVTYATTLAHSDSTSLRTAADTSTPPSFNPRSKGKRKAKGQQSPNEPDDHEE